MTFTFSLLLWVRSGCRTVYTICIFGSRLGYHFLCSCSFVTSIRSLYPRRDGGSRPARDPSPLQAQHGDALYTVGTRKTGGAEKRRRASRRVRRVVRRKTQIGKKSSQRLAILCNTIIPTSKHFSCDFPLVGVCKHQSLAAIMPGGVATTRVEQRQPS